MKILIIEYKCIVNEKMQPYGHAERPIDDAIRICKDLGCECSIAASEIFFRNYPDLHSFRLPNSIKVNEYDYRNIKTILKNIKVALKSAKDRETILWFTNVDWYLYLFLATHRIHNKIIATIYKDRYDQIKGFKSKKGYLGIILYYILLKGVKRVNLYFETFSSTRRFKNAVYLPDYIFTSFYKAHQTDKKIKRVVCPGTINTQKDIKGLIHVFRRIDYPLLIVGGFADPLLYNELKDIITPNITIQNRRIEYEEYCKIIAESEYCITPYNMRRYASATSGVIREAVYLGTTVIAPRKLLTNTGFNGIAYDDIDELINSSIWDNKENTIFNDLEPYKEENVLHRIKDAFSRLLE